MKVPAMIAAEFRRLTSTRMGVLAFVALMTVPLLYGGLYLWGNRDPYAGLDKIPAAIIVADSGATVNGSKVDYGDQVADRLVKGGDFDWHRIGRGTAKGGLDDSKYDFAITFPADFSSALVSASGASPHQATVTLTTNDANGYLSSTIGSQAAETIRTSIVKEVGEQAAKQTLTAISTVRGNLVTAAQAAARLSDGLSSAKSGADALASGTSQLSSGASQLSDGLGALQSKTSSLPSQTAQLASGAKQVAAGNAQLAQQVDGLAAQLQAVQGDQAALQQQLSDALSAAGVTPEQQQAILAALQTQLAAHQPQLAAGVQQAQSAVAQINQLAAGAQQVSAGASALASAAPQLSGGIRAAASGASQLADGASQASAGAATLDGGLGTLASGAQQLKQGLDDGVSQLPDSSAALRDKQAKTIADPVSLDTSRITDAGTYGAGLAPFFVALAGWIGIYALFLIVKPVSRRAITALHSPLRVTLAGWLTPALLGVIQMGALFAIVAGWLKFGVENPVATVGLMVLASITYTAIILALNVWLGSVGQFLGLVLMVLQLVTAGGTFPWQTLPGPLQALHHVFPMSYAVDALRQAMYGGNASLAWSDAGVLGLWLLGALAIAAVGVTRMTHTRTLRDLAPSLIG